MTEDHDRPVHLYRATHVASGRMYYGITDDMRRRWYLHCWHAKRGTKTHFAQAIKKHGPEAFRVTIIDVFATYREAAEAEILAILDDDATEAGFNTAFGGDVSPSLNPKVGRKISASLKLHFETHPHPLTGVKRPWMAALNARKRGTKNPNGARAASDRHKGVPKTADQNSKNAASNQGQKRTAETRARIRAAKSTPKAKAIARENIKRACVARVGTTDSPETKAKRAAHHVGKKRTGAALENIRRAQRERWARVMSNKEAESGALK